MEQDFKGVPGGDPDRRPPIVALIVYCAVCNKPGTFETRKPESFNSSMTCSSVCASALVRQQAQSRIRALLGSSPQQGSIPQKMAEEVLAAYGWWEQAQNGRVRRVRINCLHCGQPADRFAPTTSRSPKRLPKFCSWECKQSKSAGLPVGVKCRSPRKSAQTTLEEAQLAADQMNIQLLLEGDSEGVHPYECSCGKWHVGHRSKRAWLESKRAWLEAATEAVSASRMRHWLLPMNERMARRHTSEAQPEYSDSLVSSWGTTTLREDKSWHHRK